MRRIDKTTGLGFRKLRSPTDAPNSGSKSKRIKTSEDGQSGNVNATADPVDLSDKYSAEGLPKKTSLSNSKIISKSMQQKNSNLDGSHARLADEARGRINRSERCREALIYAELNEVPAIFIDSKENGRLVPNIGIDVINGCSRDRSLAESGQASQGPIAWGRVFVFVPGSVRLDVLDDFSDILRNGPAFSLVEDVAQIAWFCRVKDSIFSFPHAAPARLDLMFRFGLIGCQESQAEAQKMRALIPDDVVSDAYSFALQNAVQYKNVSMIRYCLDEKARPFCLDLGVNDYREYSPIEIAFTEGTLEIQDLLIAQMNRTTDIEELKELFLDAERWEEPPRKILELLEGA